METKIVLEKDNNILIVDPGADSLLKYIEIFGYKALKKVTYKNAIIESWMILQERTDISVVWVNYKYGKHVKKFIQLISDYFPYVKVIYNTRAYRKIVLEKNIVSTMTKRILNSSSRVLIIDNQKKEALINYLDICGDVKAMNKVLCTNNFSEAWKFLYRRFGITTILIDAEVYKKEVVETFIQNVFDYYPMTKIIILNSRKRELLLSKNGNIFYQKKIKTIVP